MEVKSEIKFEDLLSEEKMITNKQQDPESDVLSVEKGWIVMKEIAKENELLKQELEKIHRMEQEKETKKLQAAINSMIENEKDALPENNNLKEKSNLLLDLCLKNGDKKSLKNTTELFSILSAASTVRKTQIETLEKKLKENEMKLDKNVDSKKILENIRNRSKQPNSQSPQSVFSQQQQLSMTKNNDAILTNEDIQNDPTGTIKFFSEFFGRRKDTTIKKFLNNANNK